MAAHRWGLQRKLERLGAELSEVQGTLVDMAMLRPATKDDDLAYESITDAFNCIQQAIGDLERSRKSARGGK